MKEKSILVVDDEPLIRDIIKESLKDNYVITVVQNGQEALKEARKNRFNLVILDIDMPEMNGYEVCQSLRKEKAYENIPIIMLFITNV